MSLGNSFGNNRRYIQYFGHGLHAVGHFVGKSGNFLQSHHLYHLNVDLQFDVAASHLLSDSASSH